MTITNLQLMRAIQPYMGKSFTDRIPEITSSNLEQIGQTIESYPTIANEMVDVLTNQIIRTMFLTRTMDNPLSIFDKGDLSKFGKSLELIYVDLLKGKDFSERFGTSGTYEGEYLSPEKVDNVHVQYLTENSRLKYKVTISTDMLASAFKSETGLSQLINQQVSRLVDSYNVDKFLMTWKLIDKFDAVPEQGVNGGVNATNGKEMLKIIKKTIKNMKFPATRYNTAGVWTKSNPEDLIIVMTTEMATILDVDVLAGVFNLDKVTMSSRVVEVPEFRDPKLQCIIMDRDKMQIYNTKTASDTVRNGAGLFTNVFLHKWDLFGACNFANAVKIYTDGSPTSFSTLEEINMPYDVMDNHVEMKETEIEVDNTGEVKAKKEKKLKK